MRQKYWFPGEIRSEAEIGVLLTNLGSPGAPTAKALRRYLREFLSDRRVVDLPKIPWWIMLNLVILPLRARRSAERYLNIFTADEAPLVAVTRRIADGVRRGMEEECAQNIPVEVGMRYGKPGIGEALRNLAKQGCSKMLVLPMFPQYSSTTTASTVDALMREIFRWRRIPELRVLPSYSTHPGYISALANSVRDARLRKGAGRLLISFHGIPRSYVDAGDSYEEECRRTSQALAEELKLSGDQWMMAFQSRFGPGKWLEPATEEVLRDWGREGVDSVDVICPGFAVDCLETLVEIAVENREIFEASGGRNFQYIPALNDRPEHLEFLARFLSEGRGGGMLSPVVPLR